MSRPYDATLRTLIELEPAAWLDVLDIPVPDPALVRVIDSNLSTVAADTDKLVQVGGLRPFLFHGEFLSARAVDYPEHLLWYNVLARRKHGMPVLSLLVLLRPAADGPELTGEYEGEVPGWRKNLWFAYRVVRVWELPPERLLAAGLPVLPLAPIARVPPDRLPAVLTAVASRLRDEAEPALRTTLWMSTEILLGLYHPRERVKDLTREITTMILGIRGIEESSIYQDIFEKGMARGLAEGEARGRAEGEAEGEARGRAEGEARGRAEGEAEGQLEEARKILLGLGRRRFGEPGGSVLAAVAGMRDVERLNALISRILDASDWDDLLAAPES